MQLAKPVTETLLRGWPLPQPGDGGKDERGRIVVVAGSAQMPGAAMLAATAALRAGAGKLQIATTASAASAVGAGVPEAYVVALAESGSGAPSLASVDDLAARAGGADALVIGPGLVDETATAAFVRALLPRVRARLVVDAAALAAFSAHDELVAAANGEAVLTPHCGEMASLAGWTRDEVEDDPQTYALSIAQRCRAVVALKGARTYIADPSGALYCNEHGDPGLGTSGSGDVLAGIIGGLLARGTPALHAACWGVWLHARAGEILSQRVGLGFLAREIAAEIPPLMRALARVEEKTSSA